MRRIVISLFFCAFFSLISTAANGSEVDGFFYAASPDSFTETEDGQTFNECGVYVVSFPSVGGQGSFTVTRLLNGQTVADVANASILPNRVSSYAGSDYAINYYSTPTGATYNVLSVYAAAVDDGFVILSNSDGVADVLKQLFSENADYFNSFKSLSSTSTFEVAPSSLKTLLLNGFNPFLGIGLGIGASLFAVGLGLRTLKRLAFFNVDTSNGETSSKEVELSARELKLAEAREEHKAKLEASQAYEEYLREERQGFLDTPEGFAPNYDPMTEGAAGANFEQPKIYPGGVENYLEARGILGELSKTDPYYTGEAYGVFFSEKVIASNEKLHELWGALSNAERRILLDELFFDVASSGSQLDDFTRELRKTHVGAALNGLVPSEELSAFYDWDDDDVDD